MALINLRNALMASKRLPYDAEVEYLENTVVNYANYETIAFPYIDTGIPAADDVGVRISYEYRYLAANRGAMVCGSFVASGSGYFGVYNYGTYNYKMWGGATKMSTQIHVGEVLTTSLNFMESGTYEDVLDGATINSGSLSGSPTFNPGSIWAFAINKGNYSIYELVRLRIYGLKITKGSTLVRDFIPVRKGTVGYLYDRVSGALFGNAGTGDFVLGQDVVPVEYIESHGTEWIDTGVMSSRCYGAYLDFKGIDFASYMFFVCNATADDFCVGTNANSTANPYVGRIRRSLWYSGSVDKTAFVALSCKGGKILLNDVEKGTYDDTLPLAQNDNTIRMFGLSGTQRLSKCAIRRFDLYNSSQDAIFKALPVRVGTGSTWEGAMMDVLTRRIYRNAGTGAFGYGNDLRYPIPAS